MNLIDFEATESMLWRSAADFSHQGKIKDVSGDPLHGFKVKNYKKTRLVSTVFNGNYTNHYRFPLEPQAPKHRMVSWANLPMCGIPMMDPQGRAFMGTEKILEAVFSGLKPVGDVIFKNENLAECEAAEEQAKALGLEVFRYTKPNFADTHTFLMVGVNKPIVELFDLKAIADYYRKGVGAHDSLYLPVLMGVAHLTPAQALQTYDWASPENTRLLVLTGLCLGYAFESTLAILHDTELMW